MSPRARPSAVTSVHRLKITLEEVDPPIWRLVLVPSAITLDRLHAVIQNAMGWKDGHLHEFEIGGTRYGADDEDDDGEFGPASVEAREAVLADVAPASRSFIYRYDFGDDWQHRIDVEEVGPPEPGEPYPMCLDGQGACPPEDVGGAPGYKHLLEAIADPKDKEHDGYLKWVGGMFDPALFDLDETNRRLHRLGR